MLKQSHGMIVLSVVSAHNTGPLGRCRGRDLYRCMHAVGLISIQGLRAYHMEKMEFESIKHLDPWLYPVYLCTCYWYIATCFRLELPPSHQSHRLRGSSSRNTTSVLSKITCLPASIPHFPSANVDRKLFFSPPSTSTYHVTAS